MTHQRLLAVVRLSLLAITAAALVMLSGGCAQSNAGTRGFLFDDVTVGGRRLEYAAYVPRNLALGAENVPAIVFLHGRGESGSDGQKQIIQGIGSNILWNAERWPAIVLFPQKPDASRQWEEYDDLVLAMLDEAGARYPIDPSRVALTGLSQGGHGTWAIGARHSERWCALVPICGYPEPLSPEEIAAGIGDLPVWCLHGEADDVVTPSRSQVIIDAIRAQRGDANLRFTLYPGVNHNSWDKAYAEPEMPEFLLKQR